MKSILFMVVGGIILYFAIDIIKKYRKDETPAETPPAATPPAETPPAVEER